MFDDVSKKVKGTLEEQQKMVAAIIGEEKRKMVEAKEMRGVLVWVKGSESCVSGGGGNEADERNELNKRLRVMTAQAQREALHKMEHSDVSVPLFVVFFYNCT